MKKMNVYKKDKCG